MQALLDTQLVIWALLAPERLGSAAPLIESPDADLHVSAASWWEMAIKVGTGKLALDLDRARAACEAWGFRELPVTGAHARRVATLPRLHADPFDRMLVAQALHTPMHLVTADRALVGYSDLVQLVG